jgi:hypothetical protein
MAERRAMAATALAEVASALRASAHPALAETMHARLSSRLIDYRFGRATWRRIPNADLTRNAARLKPKNSSISWPYNYQLYI